MTPTIDLGWIKNIYDKSINFLLSKLSFITWASIYIQSKKVINMLWINIWDALFLIRNGIAFRLLVFVELPHSLSRFIIWFRFLSLNMKILILVEIQNLPNSRSTDWRLRRQGYTLESTAILTQNCSCGGLFFRVNQNSRNYFLAQTTADS